MRPFSYTTHIYWVGSVLYLTLVFLRDYSIVPWMVFTLLYCTLLVLGAIYIQWDFYIRSFHRGKNKKWIALTFDDGPAGETHAILDLLKAQNTPSAFFTIGKNALQHPEVVRRWKEEGHLIGNHSFEHGFHFDWQSTAKMKAEIKEANEAVEKITGLKMRLFRPPYGVTNPNLAKAIRQSGMHSIGWSVRSYDTTAKDPALLLARILRKTKGGDIILLHDSMGITRNILTELIISLRQKGYSFVRLDKLLDLPAYE